jgi:anti-sigma B factor antagonist
MSPQPPFLTLEAEHQRDAYVIRLTGELDLARCADLDLALEDAEETMAARIVIDLEELTFIDSSGLETLLSASRRSASNGSRLELTRGKARPAYMFRLTALEAALPLSDPALCPAIRGLGVAPRERSRRRRTQSSMAEVPARAPDGANLARVSEPFVGRPAS